MAFFNFRRDGSPGASNPAALAPETVDVVRRRAKHRLIGSAVLVLAGVLGFPLLFDTQPRPVAADIPIEIPGKGAVKPLVIAPTPTSSAKPAADKPAADKSPSGKSSSEKVTADASLDPKEEILSSKQAPAQVIPAQAAIKNEAKPVEKVLEKSVEKTEPKVVLKPSAPVTAAEGRLVVQVGAFADAGKAREARIKLEKAGLKTYTQVADTKDGKRTRVRVGPFASKADAEKAASKIKTLDLPAAILTL
jgi:DedD protein